MNHCGFTGNLQTQEKQWWDICNSIQKDGGGTGDRLQLTSFTPAPSHSHKDILPLAPSLILNHSFATCVKKYIRGKEVADKVIETVLSARKLVNVQCTLCSVRVWGPEGINYKLGRQSLHEDKHAEDVCRVGQCYTIYISKGKENIHQ